MPLFHLVVLALVQGITEFLPVSSSAHLVLVPYLTGWPDQGLVLDIAVHVGTLVAVLLYFRRDVGVMALGGLRLLGGRMTPGGRLALLVVLATIPTVLAGLAFAEQVSGLLRSVELIAWTTIGFGILLWLADRFAPAARGTAELTWRDALLVGLAQAVALIPGTSRSGITMTAGRALGLERAEAARFSLLLSIPTIIGAGALAGAEIAAAGDLRLGREALIAAAFACLAALAAISLMMRWLRRASFAPFVLYRIILGGALLAYLYA